MPRPRRNFLPERLYLVSQQGNKQHPVYLDEEDRAAASRFLYVCALRYGVRVLAYRHGEFEGRWLLRPSNRRGISNMMRDMQSAYSRYLNARYDHRPCCAHRRMSGMEPCHPGADRLINSSNWTPRFKVTEIGEEYYEAALSLIENLAAEQPGITPSSPVPDLGPPVAARPQDSEPRADSGEALACEDSAPLAKPVHPLSEIRAAFQNAIRRSQPLGVVLLELHRRHDSQASSRRIRGVRHPAVEHHRTRHL